MAGRIVLAEPVLLPMRPKERADAVRLLAALMLAARAGQVTSAETLPMAEVVNGNPQTGNEPGEAA